MENANIALFEQDEDIRHYTRLRLQRDGHTIVAEAGALGEVQTVIEHFEPGSVDVVLTVNYGGMYDAQLGTRLVNDIRQTLGTVAIVDTSVQMRDFYPMTGADAQIEKFEIEKIAAYILAL